MSHTVTVKLFDLAANELADISAIALEKKLEVRLNARRSFTVQAPAGHTLLTSAAGDGYPNLRKGNRKLVVWEDAEVIFHGRVFVVERVGDGRQNLVTITAFDPWMELGFDSEDRAGRPVRDADGSFVNPTFVSHAGGGQTEISGPDLVKQILQNSQQTGDETDPTPGEGPLPIDLTGTFNLTVPPAIDLTPSETMSWPILCGDFFAMLVDTGVVDIVMAPLEPGDGTTDYKMVALSAVTSHGTDRHASVHFDYWTGSRNASACRHVEDFSPINNKLYDYLGPRIDPSHWKANITPSHPGAVVDPTDSRDLYGVFMQIRALDSFGDQDSERPLYIASWNAEQGYRVEPRSMLFITPNPDAKALFEPPADYDAGDLVAINTGADFGLALAATQRVHGYDKSWDRQGVARVSQLLTTADVA